MEKQRLALAKPMMPMPALAMIAVAFFANSASAEEDGIATDRPDFVESSNTVGHGRFQFESSINYEKDSAEGVSAKTFSTPTLFRYGFSENLEARLEMDGFISAKTDDSATGESNKENGISDIAIGVKWHSYDGNEAEKPSIGWLFHADLPTGAEAFKGHSIRPSVRGVAEWDLPNAFSLGVMSGLIWDTDSDNKRFVGGILGVVVGKEFSDSFRGFVEWSGQELTSDAHGGSNITYDTGVAYLINKMTQVDTAMSFGANDETADFSWTLGLSMKF